MESFGKIVLFFIGFGGFIFMSCTSSGSDADATGVFEATEVLVSAEADGRILRFDIMEGDELKAGQEVGCIDTVQLALSRRQLLETRNAADWKRYDVVKQMSALRRQIEQAEQDVERSRHLFQKNAATKKQRDDAEAQLAVLRREYDAQRSTLENANNSVDHEQQALTLQVMQLDDRLEKCRLRSPISGRVLAKYAEAGELTGTAVWHVGGRPGVVYVYHGSPNGDANELIPADYVDPISGFPGFKSYFCRMEKVQ